jgi:hypothetical protein
MDRKNNERETSKWVGRRLGELNTPEGWEPDVDRAYGIFRQRSQRRASAWQAWMWAGASAAAACLIFLALPATRTAASATLRQLAGGLDARQGTAAPTAVFDDSGRLQFPSGYRTWVYVGTSLGLSYSEDPITEAQGESFQNVYIAPDAYAAYLETGQFPEGTVLVLEIATSEMRNEPALRGRFEGEILGIEASVKDSSRFEEGWAYFSFRDRSGAPRQVAEAFPADSCWTCHHDHAETDHVFTQFYPVLTWLPLLTP